MARRTVKIEIPIKDPDKFRKLLDDIQKEHVRLAANSPLNNQNKVVMATFDANRQQAGTYRDQAKDLHEEAENINEQAETIYGRDKGQGITTPGTLYRDVNELKKVLVSFHSSNEEALSQYGFNVVIGTARSPKRKP